MNGGFFVSENIFKCYKSFYSGRGGQRLSFICATQEAMKFGKLCALGKVRSGSVQGCIASL